MPVPKELVAVFEENNIYHVFCKSIGGINLFNNPVDKDHFLVSYFSLLESFAETYFFNLLDNHVHFAIKIKSRESILSSLQNYPSELLIPTQRKFLKDKCSLHTLIAKQFQRLFIKYTIYFNSKYCRKGHLFNRPFKRKLVVSDAYFTQLMIYIHANGIHHKIHKTITESQWSSYNEILGCWPTKIPREEILKLYGGRENFILLHKEMISKYSYQQYEDI